MLTLLKLIELVIIFLVIRFFIGLISGPQNKSKSKSKSRTSTKRFDSKGADISDGEFKDIS